MYCEETARRAVKRRIENLEKEPKGKSITMLVRRIGSDVVIDAMCKYEGLMHRRYTTSENYNVSIDDLRMCVHELRSKMIRDDHYMKTMFLK